MHLVKGATQHLLTCGICEGKEPDHHPRDAPCIRRAVSLRMQEITLEGRFATSALHTKRRRQQLLLPDLAEKSNEDCKKCALYMPR